jgi:hypothetical protein
MRARNYLALAAAAAVTATASAAIPALAAPATARHTLHFDAVQVYAHQFSASSHIELDKDVSGGKVIGTDELDWSGNNAAVALALGKGFLYGRFTVSNSGIISGSVTGGTGAYRGASGSISGHAVSSTVAAVTVKYRS